MSVDAKRNLKVEFRYDVNLWASLKIIPSLLHKIEIDTKRNLNVEFRYHVNLWASLKIIPSLLHNIEIDTKRNHGDTNLLKSQRLWPVNGSNA